MTGITQAASGRARQAPKSLTLEAVTKRYGALAAVDDVSLDVPAGQFLTLLGPSGSGKTTILMMIAGFVAPTTGRILVDARDITALPPERRNFGVVFQGYALFPHMTVAQNIAYPLQVRGLKGALIAVKVRSAMAQVRLEGLAERLPRQLSGGQQQRVAIARALVFDPDIFLFDEPLGALDRQLRGEVQVELKALHARLGATFVYVTHDQEEALGMADRVAIASAGRIVQAGSPAELYERPATRFVAGFLGESNFLSGRVAGGSGHHAAIQVNGLTIRHAGPLTPDAEGQALLALRPEKLALTRSPPPEPANAVAGHVTGTLYQGATLRVSLTTPELGPLQAALFAWSATTPLAPGTPVWATWPPDATVAVLDDAV